MFLAKMKLHSMIARMIVPRVMTELTGLLDSPRGVLGLGSARSK